MRWLVLAPLLLAGACSSLFRTDAIGGRDDDWTLLEPPPVAGFDTAVADVVPIGGQVWFATDEGDPRTVISRVMRIERGEPVEIARRAGGAARLLPQPGGVALVAETGRAAYSPTGYLTNLYDLGADGHLRVTWLDGHGRVIATADVAGVVAPSGRALPAAGHAAGGVALLGLDGKQRRACILVELDGRGRERSRHELIVGNDPSDICEPADLIDLDGDVIAAAYIRSYEPVAGAFFEAVVVRLGPAGEVRWRRELRLSPGSITVDALARGRTTVTVAGVIAKRALDSTTVEIGPRPVELGIGWGRDHDEAYAVGQEAYALGLDPDTGASRWFELVPADGDVTDEPGGMWAAGRGAGVALAIQTTSTRTRDDGARVSHQQLLVTAIDEATGARRWSRIIVGDRGDDYPASLTLRRAAIADDGGLYLAGQFRRTLTIGDAVLRGNYYVEHPCRWRTAGGALGAALFAEMPPPLPHDPCAPIVHQPARGFVARGAR